MQNKRFAFVIKDLYGGGAERSLIYTADSLRQRGHIIKIILLRELIEHEIPAGLDIEILHIHGKLTRALNNILVEKWQAKRVAQVLDVFSPDIVLSCAADKITRHLHHPHLYFWIKSDISAKFKSTKKRTKAFAKARRFYNGRNVIAVSQGVKHNLLDIVDLEPADIQAIYNPYEREPFLRMAAEPAEIPNPDYLIHVGSFEPRKRHDRLLRAYKTSGVKTPLFLLGKGGEEERIRGMIDELGLAQRVHILGYQINPYPFIKHARALILTSDSEGLPRVLIESLLLETPIVSVDCPSGPREILSGELADFLVPMNDEAALAKAIACMDAQPVRITEAHYRPFLKETVLPQFEAL